MLKKGGMLRMYQEGGKDPLKEKVSAAELARMLAERTGRQVTLSGVVPAMGDEESGFTTAAESTAQNVTGIPVGLGEKSMEEPTTPPEKQEETPPRPPRPIKTGEKKPSPTQKKEERKDDPADFSSGKSSLSFTPMFEGNIQQTGFRGEGTSGALTGVFVDVKNPDGTMDRVKTRLDDVPEYITKDPYFERLLEVANKKYFELEREKGVSGGIQAGKSPEAQMIARILSGDITIEEAKRQANYQRQSF